MLLSLFLMILLDLINGLQVEAAVRVLNGFDSCSGRVEFFFNGTWGTVCDDDWDASDAAVVCRQLGCGHVVQAKSVAYFGQGSGQIWMDEVSCVGTETSIIYCPREEWGVNDCSHGEDAGVICQANVRLENGSSSCSGRVEVLYDGVWGTVCDNSWDLADAAVVCRELDCPNAIEAKLGAYFSQGSGKVWIDAAQCSGSETTLVDCSSTRWDIQSCSHEKDAGVVCTPAVRLVNGPDSCSGRVEVLHGGRWGTVCSDSWDAPDAAVVCKEVGCPIGVEAKRFTYFGLGSGPIWMDEVRCKGTESTLKDCPFYGWGTHNCDHTYDAGVICRDIRLVNGGNQCSGRVEVLHDGQWGTICDAGWDLTDATVVCKQMGCGIPVAAKTGAYFGQGSGSVWMEDVSCSGTETSVKNCPSKEIGTSTCSHGQDAGVMCREIKLVGGTGPCDGRLLIFNNQHWGSVCHTGWGLEDATVLCKALGCGEVVKATSYAGPYVGPKWMDNVACTGSEVKVQSCPFTGWGVSACGDGLYAGAVCSSVKLVNGGNQCSGRVEVLLNGQWGTICDAGWDLTDAAVVCKHMGCGTPIEAKTGAFFGEGAGPVLLDDVRCTGREQSVIQCPSKALGTSTCSHGQDAGVVCRDIKVVNGTGLCDGKAQVLYNGQWGSVCNTDWDVDDATVLCSELGCGEVVQPVSYAGSSAGPIWMDSVACTGKEWTVRDCLFTGWGVSSCGDELHAGVVCIRFVRRDVVRIVVRAQIGINVNDPNIKNSLMDKISKVVKSKGNYLANWRTQNDGKIFHKIIT